MFKASEGEGSATRQRILEAALRLFRERGFEATTMRDIAAASGGEARDLRCPDRG